MRKVRSFLKAPIRTALFSAVSAGLLGAVSPAVAQQDDLDDLAQPVVQAIPNNDSMNLNAALTRLGKNPRDLDALIDAGNAAQAIGDTDAAIGFFSRADQVAPGNNRARGGLASAQVFNGNPIDAISLFDQAEASGPLDGKLTLDRGLAYDLVGDNVTAQRYYRQALAQGANDEASRRLAVSLAIAGDKRGAANALSSLLMRRDMAAWRARAFSLAILDQVDEAVAVVNSTLPPALSASIAPYLRYMPRLTPAQQAAAANFGQFPRASEIGQDDPRIARYAPSTSRRPSLASSDSALIPAGEPLGRKGRNRDKRNDSRNAELNADRQAQTRVAKADEVPSRIREDSRPVAQPVQSAPVAAKAAIAPLPIPAPTPVTVTAPVQTAQVAARIPVPDLPAQPLPTQPLPAAPSVAAVSPIPSPTELPAPQPVEPAAAPAQPAIAPAQTQPSAVQAPAATPIATPQAAPVLVEAPAPPRRPSLAEAFSDLAKPAADVTPARGAVDIRRIRPAREGALNAAPEKPAPPSHPSRIWVQLATGRDKSALGFDWRRMSRQADAIFKGKQAHISAWGQTNRLLTGPFASEAAANAFLAQLRKADISGAFVWNSPAGQVVDAVGGK